MPGAGAIVATKRIKKEIADLAKENLGTMTLSPNESNILVWKATLPGPAGSPYEGGLFEVDIRVPEDYPFSPPKLQFLTKVYHCNIAQSGAICLDLLKNAWSPALSLYKVILSLSSLLTDPNPADPLVPQIASEYKRDRKKHDQTAKEWTQLYAKRKITAPTTIPAPVASRPTITTSVGTRAIPRETTPAATSSSVASQAPAQIAGTRRSYATANANGNGLSASRSQAIDLVDSDEESDIEVVNGSNGRPNGDIGVNGVGSGSGGSATTQAKARAARSAKRAKASHGDGEEGGSGRNGAEDVIVIDE